MKSNGPPRSLAKRSSCCQVLRSSSREASKKDSGLAVRADRGRTGIGVGDLRSLVAIARNRGERAGIDAPVDIGIDAVDRDALPCLRLTLGIVAPGIGRAVERIDVFRIGIGQAEQVGQQRRVTLVQIVHIDRGHESERSRIHSYWNRAVRFVRWVRPAAWRGPATRPCRPASRRSGSLPGPWNLLGTKPVTGP